MTEFLAEKIRNCIQQHGEGWCFTPTDFSDIASNDVVRQTLSRLNKVGFIDRLAQGVYYFPQYHGTLGKLPPKIEAIINAIQNVYHIKCQPTGAYAANLLGLSEQVPTSIVLLTDGPSKKIQVGNKKIIFKRTTPKNMVTAGTITGLIIQGIKFIGKEHINSNYLKQLKNHLSDEQIKLLNRDVHLAPAWIAKLIKSEVIGD
jgi:predicted transcriptional regulator of viral defense system